MTTETTAAEPLSLERHLRRIHGWHAHPAVRSDRELTFGERAADRMRNGMGSWAFVFWAIAFLALWMLYNGLRGNAGYDKYPFILLNLVLSCLAAMQGAILLIAAKRSDQVAAELAQHDFETDSRAEQLVETLTQTLIALKQEQHEMRAQLAAISRQLNAASSPDATP